MKIYLFATLFLILAITSRLWYGANAPIAEWLPQSAISIVLCVGFMLRQRWTEAALFGLALYICVSWIAVVAAEAVLGWPEVGTFRTVISLLPGIALCSFWTLAYLAVKDYFRSPQAR